MYGSRARGTSVEGAGRETCEATCERGGAVCVVETTSRTRNFMISGLLLAPRPREIYTLDIEWVGVVVVVGRG